MKHTKRLASVLLPVLLASRMSGAEAHEMRPSVADITRSGKVVQIELSTNLEALISGVAGEHDDSNDAPQAERYLQLRQLAPDALETEFRQYLPTFLSGVSLGGATATDTDLPLTLATVNIPAVGDTDLARDSVLLLQAPLANAIEAVTWQWDSRYGSIILRAQTVTGQGEVEPDVTRIGLDAVPTPGSATKTPAGGKPDSSNTPSVFTQLLLPGKPSELMGIAPSVNQDAGIGFRIYLLIAFALLTIGAVVFHRFVKRR